MDMIHYGLYDLGFWCASLFFFLPLWVRSVQTEEASQHKLETSSSKSDKSQYGQAKNEESASNDQSAGKSFEVEPGKNSLRYKWEDQH